MSLGTLMSSRHSLPEQRSHSCIRSIRTNHLSFRHSNWIHQNWIHQNCRRRRSGFHLSCRSLNVKFAGRHVEQPCAPSESFCGHLMNCCRQKMMSRHRKKMSRRKMSLHRMMMNHLMNCFRRYCLNHRRNHKHRCNGGSSQPEHHSRQTPLLKER